MGRREDVRPMMSARCPGARGDDDLRERVLGVCRRGRDRGGRRRSGRRCGVGGSAVHTLIWETYSKRTVHKDKTRSAAVRASWSCCHSKHRGTVPPGARCRDTKTQSESPPHTRHAARHRDALRDVEIESSVMDRLNTTRSRKASGLPGSQSHARRCVRRITSPTTL